MFGKWWIVTVREGDKQREVKAFTETSAYARELVQRGLPDAEIISVRWM